ncbi:MAG TPA: MFS transporter, partial [Alphaproteobacteria bacterium]|nr:MFS transporter [Alphaproteobacteria bacterium]
PEEGEARIEALLGSGAAVTRRPIRREEIPGLPEAMGLPDAITPAGDLRTLPCHLAEHGGLDGFFVARLGKKT